MFLSPIQAFIDEKVIPQEDSELLPKLFNTNGNLIIVNNACRNQVPYGICLRDIYKSDIE